jgi:hypothetical protein
MILDTFCMPNYSFHDSSVVLNPPPATHALADCRGYNKHVFDYDLDTSGRVPPTYCQRKYELKAVLDKVYYRSKGWKRV